MLPSGLSRSREIQNWTGIPYLASIPRAGSPDVETTPSAAVVEYPASAFAASFRQLRAALLRVRPDVRVVALTSALPKDGKTTCSVALARQSALEGYKTVLVDCDLRRRSSTAELETTPAVGLLEVIDGRCPLEQALLTDRLTSLSFLPIVGDLDAIEQATVQDVFATDAMSRLVASLRERFDYVFIDTPPVLAVVDARRLAHLVDTFVFLTRWKYTPRLAVRRAIDLLHASGAPLAGLVLTNAPPLPSHRARAAVHPAP